MDRVIQRLIWPVRIVLLALAYGASAHLAYLVSNTGNFVSVVFPPAGIALAAILIWGWRVSPGIFIGATCTQLILGREVFLVDAPQLVVAVVIAAGATLQALAGGQLCRRLAAKPVEGWNDWHELRIVFLGGPLACVISAAIGNAVLVWGGVEPANALLVNFLGWWVGDTIGVVIFTPLVLLVLQPRFYGRENRSIMLMMSVLAMLGVLLLFYYASRYENFRIATAFQQEAQHHVEQLERRASIDEEVLHSLRRLWGSSEAVEKEEFERFVSDIVMDNPDILSLAWVPAGSQNAQIAYISSGKSVLSDGMALDEIPRFRGVRDRARKNDHTIIMSCAGQAIGLKPEHAVMMVLPVYRHDSLVGEARAFDGFVVGLFDLSVGVKASLGLSAGHLLPMTIQEDGRFLPCLGSQVAIDKQPINWTTTLSRGGHEWQVAVSSPEGFRVRHRSIQMVFLLGGGLLLLGLLQALLLAMRRSMRLRLKAADAERARELAEQTAKTKSSFLATMSHEIRTPMNGVIGMTQLLSDTSMTTEQQHYVSTIRQSCEALLRIINDILDHAKIEAGKLEVEHVPFSLPQLLDECASLFMPLSAESGVRLMMEKSSDLPNGVLGDSVRLRQILINLLSNAFKFTRKGSVVLRVRVHEDNADATVVYFEVEDTGIGMDKQQREHLFNAFSQGDSSITRKYGGTGLGLSICRQLVELMHGQIGVSSETDKGSVFWFSLPLHKTVHEGTLPFSARPQPIRDISGLRVLVAEDNKVNQQVIGGLLKKYGLHAVMTKDGVEALQHLTAHHQDFDLVFMDCEMPNMDGYAATTRLRQWEATEGVSPIFICGVSAHVIKEFKDRALQAGMDDFIVKPLHRADLLRILQDVAGRH
ncbi:MAG: response regulator [Moraxellaceae bacterium]|nr:response regulator [Moraxellaceae bacterium]MBP8852222.1 response regulator [Moraxellaceae bacterium]MBP9044790.1 response regulator [Moraxellaceae bacterium]MBP9730461.1 response regulator [Moraxellaceae bacterium]HQV41481.1 ATP-binding protein [Moraxellaceae bacterium]